MRKVYAVVAVVLLVGLAGCISITIEATVDEDGMVSMDGEIEFDQEAVQMLELMVEEEPEYDDVGEWLIADMEEDEDTDEFDGIEYDYYETDDGGLVLEISSDPTDPEQLEDITVTVDEEEQTVTFVDVGGIDDDEFDDGGEDDDFGEMDIEMTYRLNMPGEITDTNGDQVDDTTVEWVLPDHEDLDELQATSGIDESSDGIPGFGLGITAAALALLATAAAVLHRRR